MQDPFEVGVGEAFELVSRGADPVELLVLTQGHIERARKVIAQNEWKGNEWKSKVQKLSFETRHSYYKGMEQKLNEIIADRKSRLLNAHIEILVEQTTRNDTAKLLRGIADLLEHLGSDGEVGSDYAWIARWVSSVGEPYQEFLARKTAIMLKEGE